MNNDILVVGDKEVTKLGWRNKFKRVIKRVVFSLLYYSGSLNALVFLISKLKKEHCSVILFYHRFSENAHGECELPHLRVSEFEKQMWHVKKFYKIITMDELAEELKLKKNNESPCVAITIDDGYLNNYNLAYPVLKKLNLPATIYLTTGFIGTEKSVWVDQLMDIFLASRSKSFSFPELFGVEVFDLSTAKNKRETFTRYFEKILYAEDPIKNSLMEELAKVLVVDEDDRVDGERKMLNWEEVIEMSRNGISFGAHSVNHPTLSKIELSEAKQEIYDSRREIETKIGCKVKHFAIPNGKKKDFNGELKEFCKEIGFTTIVTTEHGVVNSESDPYFLRRINPSPPIYVFACELARYMFLNRGIK